MSRGLCYANRKVKLPSFLRKALVSYQSIDIGVICACTFLIVEIFVYDEKAQNAFILVCS